MSHRSAWPQWVYGEGDEPDYRFSFANERTFLAWIRTSLALLAAGVALDVVDLSMSSTGQRAVSILLVALSLIGALIAWIRWAMAERAMRHASPLPSFGISAIVTIALMGTAITLALFGL